MKKAILYGLIGTLIGFLANFILYSKGWQIDLYEGFAFGLGWGMAYFVDMPTWKLSSKLGISFLGIAALVAIGLLFFNFEIAVLSIIKYSTIFLVYYLIGSFKDSKSLRN